MKFIGVLAALLVACGSGGSSSHPSAPPTAPAEPAAGPTAPPPPAPKTLYDRLGGQPAVTAVVAEFVARTTSDDRIKDRFFNVDAENLKKLLVEFVCVAGGGGCTYEGRDMTKAHAGMLLVDDEFNALVEDLSGALDKFNVPAKEKGELLGALGPLKPQMVVPAEQLHPIDAAKLASVTKLAATIKDTEARRLLQNAVIAGTRGQRSYAEQLFSRAELVVGVKPLAGVAAVFRAGAPQRVTTPTKKLPDAGPQPTVVGKDDEAELPKPKGPIAVLHGALTVDGKPLQGIGVVMMYGAGGVKRTAKRRVIEQRNKTFAPHVTAVPVGSTISFPNYDDLFHNVFSVSKAKAFDLGLYKNGETREITLDKAGVIRVGCNIHANMSAYIIAVDAPHYTVVDPDGTFVFNTLLPGKYRAQIWLGNAAEPLTTEVQIKPGDNQLSLDLKGGDAGVSPDKFGAPR
jgi:hemoglobin